jgi:hypothetical protein
MLKLARAHGKRSVCIMELLSDGFKLKCVSFDEDAEYEFFARLESAAEDLLQQIEKEEGRMR